MVKYFRWMSSPGNRGNVVLEYGKIYDADKLELEISPESWKVWAKEGTLIPLDSKKKPLKEKEPNPEKSELLEPESEPEEVETVDKKDKSKEDQNKTKSESTNEKKKLNP